MVSENVNTCRTWAPCSPLLFPQNLCLSKFLNTFEHRKGAGVNMFQYWVQSPPLPHQFRQRSQTWLPCQGKSWFAPFRRRCDWNRYQCTNVHRALEVWQTNDNKQDPAFPWLPSPGMPPVPGFCDRKKSKPAMVSKGNAASAKAPKSGLGLSFMIGHDQIMKNRGEGS